MPPKKALKTYIIRHTYEWFADIEVEAKSATEALGKAERIDGERDCDIRDRLIDSEIIGVRDDD